MTEQQSGSGDLIETLKELWLTESDLTFLHDLEPAMLARITSEVQAADQRLKAGQHALFESIAKVTRYIPNFLLSKFSGSLSPYVMAKITEHLEPKEAASLSKLYEPTLLAEISLHLDAKFAAAIASYTDVDTLTIITETLAKKGLSRRLGEISDALDEKLLGKLVERIGDPEKLASVAAHMTSRTKLSNVAKRLDNKARQAVISILQRQGHAAAAQALLA